MGYALSTIEYDFAPIEEILGEAPAAIVLVDASGRVIRALGRAIEEATLAIGPLVGRSAVELARDVHVVPRNSAPCTGEVALWRALAGETLEGRAHIGTHVLEARVTSHVAPAGEVIGASIVALDVTEDTNARVEAATRDRLAALATLAAGVGNAINEPLTNALVELEFVQRKLRVLAADIGSAALRGGLESVLDATVKATEAANRIRMVARDVLVFAHGDVEARVLVDVRAILESALQMEWHEIRQRARVVKHLSDVPLVEANELQLGHVFVSLLANAAHAIPEGRADREEVRVTTSTDDNGDVVIEVSDTGLGIPEATLPLIFDPFFTTHERGRGAGLGLSIARGIVSGLGGELSARSAPGAGSTFRMVLPAATRWRVRNSVPCLKAPATEAKECRILVLDSDPGLGAAIARSLGDEHDVTVSVGPIEALRLLESSRFDLVLYDLTLPEMSGVEFYVRLLRIAPDAVRRVAFMASGAASPGARAFLSSISTPCLEKPLDMARLRRLVGRAGDAR